MTRFSFWAAPALLFAYGVARLADGSDGSHGPGLAWTIGHVFFLLSLTTFGAVLFGLRRQLPGRRIITTTAVAAGFVGLLAFIRSVIVDLIAGFQAVSRPGMDHIYKRYEGFPGGLPTGFVRAFDNAGPPLFILGLLTLVTLLAAVRPRALPWWSPVLAATGFACITVSLDLLPVGGAFLFAALFPLARAAGPAMRAVGSECSEPARPELRNRAR